MPALDALFLKNILSDDLRSNAMMRGLLEGMVRSMRGDLDEQRKGKTFSAGQAVPVGDPDTFPADMTGAKLTHLLSTQLEAAYSYYVDPRMHELITAASESMPQEELRVGDLPTDVGFLVIPGGVGTMDVRGALLKFHAVLWVSYGGHVHVYWLTDKTDMTDGANNSMHARLPEETWQRVPRLTLAHKSLLTYGKALPTTVGPKYLVPPEIAIQVKRQQNPDGTTSLAWFIPDKGMDAEQMKDTFEIGEGTEPASRWLLTVWRLMQQTVTNVTEEQAPRQLRKQLEKKNLDSKVSVIALRHKSARGEGDSDIEWSHRWLVRGHWRNQPCKDENGEWTTRMVWIHPHVKGPDDKPLLVREHVYNLTR